MSLEKALHMSLEISKFDRQVLRLQRRVKHIAALLLQEENHWRLGRIRLDMLDGETLAGRLLDQGHNILAREPVVRQSQPAILVLGGVAESCSQDAADIRAEDEWVLGLTLAGNLGCRVGEIPFHKGRDNGIEKSVNGGSPAWRFAVRDLTQTNTHSLEIDVGDNKKVCGRMVR